MAKRKFKTGHGEVEPKIIDATVSDQGSIFLVTPLTSDAKEWIEQNVSEDHQFFGNALVVEHRYIAGLVAGMRGDGLEVQ